MNDFLKQLLYSDVGSEINNWALLFFRILLALELFRVHGMKKLRSNNGQREDVSNPLHLPEGLNRSVAIFATVVAPFLVMLGLATRLVVLPIIGVVAAGYFIVHRKDPLEVRDMPYMYTLSFLLLLIIGPGTYSIDHYFLYPLF